MDLRARGTSVTLTPRVNLRPNSSHHHKPGTPAVGSRCGVHHRWQVFCLAVTCKELLARIVDRRETREAENDR